MPEISQLELKPRMVMGFVYQDFILNGLSLKEHLSFTKYCGERPTEATLGRFKKTEQIVLSSFSSRLGYAPGVGPGIRSEHASALEELLLLKGSERSGGRSAIYTCYGCCYCEYITVAIEQSEEWYVWRDFRLEMPMLDSAALRCADSLDVESEVCGGPFYFDAASYRNLFESELRRLNAF